MTTIQDPFNLPPPQTQRRTAPAQLAESLAELNLEDELLIQYSKANALLSSVEFDSETPLNQKAQAQNSIVAILSAIIKNQEAVRNMAEVNVLEAALGDTLKEFPEIKEAFLARYEGKLLQAMRQPTVKKTQSEVA